MVYWLFVFVMSHACIERIFALAFPEIKEVLARNKFYIWNLTLSVPILQNSQIHSSNLSTKADELCECDHFVGLVLKGLKDNSGIRAHSHFVCKRTLSHLGELAKCINWVFLSYLIRVFRKSTLWNYFNFKDFLAPSKYHIWNYLRDRSGIRTDSHLIHFVKFILFEINSN